MCLNLVKKILTILELYVDLWELFGHTHPWFTQIYIKYYKQKLRTQQVVHTILKVQLPIEIGLSH
jgi:hypothetical protein